MKIRIALGQKSNIAVSYLNIGTAYAANGNYVKAQDYLDKSLAINNKLSDNQVFAAVYQARGQLFRKKKQYEKGIRECKKGLFFSEKIKDIIWKESNCECLALNYEGLGDYKNALSYYRKHILLRDSIKNESTDREIAQKEVEYEYKQKAEIDSIHNAEMMKVQEAELKAQDIRLENEKTYKAALGFGLFGVALFLFLLYKRFVVAKEQKSEIEEKNKHITDSIQYAKRIQDAILTSEQDIKEALDDYFIYYQPKEIVSGDFYWVHKINNEKVMLAVASPSREGVPGAFMGMIATALLNEIVIENGVTDVLEVAVKMQEQLSKTFKERNNATTEIESREKDNMKLSLVCLNKKTKKLELVGAGQSVYWISNNKLSELKSDDYPIELFVDKRVSYSKKELQLDVNNMLYISTDGVINQLGKPSFSKLLEGSVNRTTEEQNEQLGIALNKAAKTNASKDDACIMGVRI